MNNHKINKSNKDYIFFLLKFGKRKNIESLQNGKLYMKNLKYFIDIEKEKAQKGMGDINEGKLVMNNIDFKLIDPKTKNILFQGYAEKAKLEIKEDHKKPVFCMSCIDFNSLEIEEETESTLVGKLIISERQKKEFINEFGDTVLLISFSDFINRITRVFKENNISFIADKVKYSDYSINYMDRLNSSIKQNEEKFFWKDIFFNYQKEFRIVILNKEVDNKFEIDIGSIKDFSKIVSAEEFLNGDFRIRINLKKKLILEP